MKRIYALLGLTALVFASSGAAQASTDPGQRYYLQTGSDLERVCATPADPQSLTTEERERLLVCGSYIQGFLGHYGVVRSEMTAAPFCLPANGVSGEQVRRLFLALLQQKPQIRDLPASVDLATSLAWGYACPRKTSATKPSGAPATPSNH